MSINNCPNCSANITEEQTECSVCGANLNQQQPVIQGNKFDEPVRSWDIADTTSPQHIKTIGSAEVTPYRGKRINANTYQLNGIVVKIHHPVHEPADFNLYKVLSSIIIVLLLLPVIIFLLIFKIVIRIALGIIGIRSGGSIFGNFFWIMFGRGARGRDAEVPVLNIIIRTEEGSERNVRIKGDIIRGTLNEGNQVGFNGNWDQGTFIFRKGYNYSLNSHIQLKQNFWKFTFFILTIIFIGLTIYIINQPPPYF